MLTYVFDIIITAWVVVTPLAVLLLFLIKNQIYRALVGGCLLFAMILIILQPDLRIPVKGASKNDWNPKSFWAEPWGKSIVHRGIDIFAKSGTPVVSPTLLFVFRVGSNPTSGKYILAFDHSLRVHFFAHLKSIKSNAYRFYGEGKIIGTVGNTGNAAGKPPHLHYALGSFVPQPWYIRMDTLGHLRAFFLNPENFFISQNR